MNNFIRHSNKALLIAVVVLGFGAWTSQLNRANAVTIIGCGDNDGSIGTGAGCVGPVTYTYTNTWCQLGGDAATTYCCFYKYSDYYCTNSAGVRVFLGNKGDLMSGIPGGVCVSENSNNEVCASPDGEAPVGERGSL